MDFVGDSIVHVQVDVPAGSPYYVLVFFPNDIVGKEDFSASGLGSGSSLGDHVVIGVFAVFNGIITGFDGVLEGGLESTGFIRVRFSIIIIIGEGGSIVVLDTKGLHSEANNSVLGNFFIGLMIFEFNVHMIVNIGHIIILGHKSNGESVKVFGVRFDIILHLGGGGEIIDDPVIVVVLANGPYDLAGSDTLGLDAAEVGDADLFAVHVLLHLEFVGRVLDAVAGEEFAEVFICHFDAGFGLAEGQAVVLDRVLIVE